MATALQIMQKYTKVFDVHHLDRPQETSHGAEFIFSYISEVFIQISNGLQRQSLLMQFTNF